MNSNIESNPIFKSLLDHLDALNELEPNRFAAKMKAAKTLIEVYEVILELGYAANSKELRDTWDDRVHVLCEQIRSDVAAINSLLRIQIKPNSEQQKQQWNKSILLAPTGKYAFRNDGSLEIGLLEAQLKGDVLSVKRIWNHVCNFSGDQIDFQIKLDASQIEAVKNKQKDIVRIV